MRILIVEDEQALAMVVGDALSEAGHDVVGSAATLDAALDLVRAKAADLALVNVRLADGSRGTDLARILIRDFGVPTIFMTGSVDEARRAQESALGFIAKPYDPAAVVESVAVAEKIMDGRSVDPKELPPGLTLF